MRSYPQFWNPIALAKISFFRIVINQTKNTSLLVVTIIKLKHKS